MTWKPESEQICETVSLNKTINTATTAYHSGIINKFKQSQGTTFGDFGFPEAAPLVFPTLDLIGASDHEEAKKFKDKIKRKKNFVANYYDKRATAEFVSLILHKGRAAALFADDSFSKESIRTTSSRRTRVTSRSSLHATRTQIILPIAATFCHWSPAATLILLLGRWVVGWLPVVVMVWGWDEDLQEEGLVALAMEEEESVGLAGEEWEWEWGEWRALDLVVEWLCQEEDWEVWGRWRTLALVADWQWREED